MANKRKLNDYQVSEIIKLYTEGKYETDVISKIYNVKITTILGYLNKNKVEVRKRKLEINPGDKFGKLTILEEASQRGGRRYFLCECSCDKKTKKEIRLYNLTSGHTISCGCYLKDRPRKRRNVIGKIYGRITILSEIKTNPKEQRRFIGKCSCDGNINEYGFDSLRSGQTTSCGCYWRERVKEKDFYQFDDYKIKYPSFCKIEEIRDKGKKIGIEVKCKYCNEWFKPTSRQIGNRIKAIEKPMGAIENNFYCSDKCKNQCQIFNIRNDPFDSNNLNIPTTYELSIWSDEIFKRQKDMYGYNFCTKCQSIEDLASHHINPKKLEPFSALDIENGVILCRDCHLNIAHSGTCSTGSLANKVCK